MSIDLNSVEDILKEKDHLQNIDYVFFAAYIEKKTPYELSEANTLLIKNLIDGLEQTSPSLKRVILIQGGKAYGAHLGYYKTPAKETDLRSITPNFYYDQEDFLRKQSKGKSWTWTAIRPDIVIGFTVNTPMNLLNLIAVYASLCKEEGIPMRFPGSWAAYNAIVNVTSVNVLTKAMEWAALDENTKEEIFNITNGDAFRWHQIWPKIGEFFNIPVAEPQTFSLQEYMPLKDALWKNICKKYNLRFDDLSKLVQWKFGDFIFNVESDSFQDVSKARRYGFNEMNIDTSEDFLTQFQQLKDEKIIP